jgi:pimeloyl-ACP methyl ester carboxylesterase
MTQPSPRPAIRYQSGGNPQGPQVVLLHGVTRQSDDMAPLFERLPESFGWVAIDFRGHGRSDRVSLTTDSSREQGADREQGSDREQGADAGYFVIDYVDDLDTVLQSFSHQWDRNEKIVLLGHSLGAMVALAAAARWPDRFAAIILEDPPLETMGSRIKASTFYRQFQGVADLLDQRLDPATLSERLRDLPVCRPDTGEVVRMGDVRDEVSIRTHAGYLANTDPRVLDPIVAGRWTEGYDLPEIAGAIRCPVLLFQANPLLGGMLIDDDAEYLFDSVNDCTLIKIETAGHLIHASQAEMMASEIVQFLADLW